MPQVGLPTFNDVVQQRFLIEPLQGPRDVFYYLGTWPEEIYSKSPDSHLYKFMRTLLGEGGVNWIKKNHLEARLQLEELGIDMFDLDKFYGDPFSFGRIVEETFDDDTYGLVLREQWEQVKAKNARYRNRALDYVNGARGGNTPLGMRLVAKSGLGHDVEIIENYKYLFDAHSDDPLGLEHYGKTLSTEEMIVLPRREVGMTEEQVISIFGSPSSGDFALVYNGDSSDNYTYDYTTTGGTVTLNKIPYNGTRDHVRLALEAIPQIGLGNVEVEGGPGPNTPWTIRFTGLLANKDVPQLVVDSTLDIRVVTTVGGKDSSDDVAYIPAKDQYALMSAIDRIRAQTTIPTLGSAPGLRSRNNWNAAFTSSEYTEVARYVTGSSYVRWPESTPARPIYWIEAQKEKQAPRVNDDLQYHYTGFHNISAVEASSSAVVDDIHQQADRVLADYAEPLFVTSATSLRDESPASFLNGIYPTEYQDLAGVPPVRYNDEQYWLSAVGLENEWLELRLPFASAVNYLSFDLGRVPLQIDIEYDARDGDDEALWVPVTPVDPYSNIMVPPVDQAQNSWASLGLSFTNSLGQLIFTRAIRITFTRLQGYTGPISARNLRLARNIG